MPKDSPPPAILGLDHIHVYVTDRAAAERWYSEVLGFKRVPRFEVWAPNGGPLFLQSANGTANISLFEKPAQPCRSTIAFGVTAQAFLAWKAHLEKVLPDPPTLDDHDLSFSLYFHDPEGNPYEITTYEYQAVKDACS